MTTSCQIRSATVTDAVGIARVHVDTWRTAYQGLVPDKMLDRQEHGTRAEQWRKILADPPRYGHVWVAEQEGTVVGVVNGGPARERLDGIDGQVYAIYVFREHQRMGLGRLLLQALVRHMQESGWTSMYLWTAEGNPSRRFFEKMGGVVLREKPVEVGGRPAKGIAYGWKDLSSLLTPVS